MELRWDTISGHEKQKEALRTMLREGRLPHALLFTGPDGIGKRMLGRVLATAILCDAEDGPCGYCESCRAMQLGSHPDYLEIAPEQNGKSAAQIRIEAIRSMQTQVSRYPVLAKQRAVLIDDADRMNEAAQNSLLKTLEEPEGPVTFILVTSARSALLDTILSRCMPVAFGMLSPQEMRSVLLRHDVPEAEAAELAALSDAASAGRSCSTNTRACTCAMRRSTFWRSCRRLTWSASGHSPRIWVRATANRCASISCTSTCCCATCSCWRRMAAAPCSTTGTSARSS